MALPLRGLAALLLLLAALATRGQNKPVPVIFDTDMGPDYDDVGAITILHAFADSGKATILATMASTRYEGVAAVIDVFNTWFHRPNIPIGVPQKLGGRPKRLAALDRHRYTKLSPRDPSKRRSRRRRHPISPHPRETTRP